MSRTRRSICLPLGLLFLVIAATVPGGPRIRAHAQTITPRAALVRVLSAPREQPGWFAPLFLAQVSVAQVEQGIAGVKAQFGPYKGVAPRPDGSYLVTFARGSVQAQIHLDGQGRIDGLLFTKPRFTYVSRAVAFQGLRALPGQVSLLVTADGAPLTSLDPDRSLAVGSAFKLAVLTALQGRIKAGELSWTQQVTLHASDKSLPGGVLQTKPDGSRYTVADLARYMISISDNTAADLLIRLVGRPAIDPLIPARDRPILTTREAFVLKDPAHRDLRDRYLAASPTERPAILAQADRLPLPAPRSFGALPLRGPLSPQVEWFFSARQLCALMARVRSLPQMGVNPGVADPSDWARVAYKGGSEPGVLNLTTMVTSYKGAAYCVSATWNNSALLDEGRFESLYGSLLHSLS